MKAAFGKWNPFRLRNLVVAALVLGILAGIWLGDLFKGFGWGPGEGNSQSAGNSVGAANGSSNESADFVGYRAAQSEPGPATLPVHEPELIRVLIDDRSYFIRRGDQKEPITLESLIRLIEETDPNEDGLRAMVDRTPSSRASAEDKLRTTLEETGIPKNSVYWTPTAVE